MTELSDADLLERYVRDGSEAAFTGLVERHLGLVHSVALRRMANVEQAQDITQAVFVILARKAATLNRRTILPGWLYHTARLTAANLQRAEASRHRREQEAYMQSIQEESPDALWTEIAPQLEEGMARLRADERDALVLRYFQNKSFAEVAAIIGKGEAAARKQVQRAVEKLRDFFLKRGIKSSTEDISRTISLHSIQPASALLAKTIAAVAVAKGATASASTLTLIKGALKIMAWTKAKTTIVTAAVVVFAAGTTTVTVKEIQRHDEDAKWDVGRIDSGILNKAPHIVRIIPTKFPGHGGWAMANYRTIGIAGDIRELVLAAYGGYINRVIYLAPMPPKKYDFIANLPNGSNEALKKEIRKQFGLVGRIARVETNVLFLKVSHPDAAGLVPTKSHNGSSSSSSGNGEFKFSNGSAFSIASLSENECKIPVIDQTGLKASYDIDLKWDDRNDPQHENFKQALKDQLGLELVPATAPVEFLIIEKAK
jgi:uncharacterized protein (TIGR03435 family)